MTPQLTHPSSDSLIGGLGSFFKSKNLYTRRDRRLVFLCGGPVTGKISFRRKFLDYAQSASSLREFRFFLAEDAAQDLFSHGEPTFINIAEFESLIGNLADCIVLIPESPGSFAELGYFSAQERIREKLLLVNDLNFQGDQSFLNLGPIELVTRHSRYRTVVQINLKAKSPQFRPIVKLLGRYSLENRGHFEFKSFDLMPVEHRLFVIFELILLFGEISYDALELLIQKIFLSNTPLRPDQKQNLRQLLSILCAGGYVNREPSANLLKPKKAAKPFLDADTNSRNSLTIQIADFVRRTTNSSATPKRIKRSKK